MSMTVDPYKISKYLRSNYGLGPEHVSGILANIKGESGFDPTINEINPTVPGSRGGYGLFQHTGPRRTKLEKMPNYQDWRSQIDFAMNEPEGRDYAAQKFTSPVEAVSYFVRNFERPRDVEEAIRKRTIDVRHAANTAGSTDTDRTPSGDPVTGRMNRGYPMLPQFPSMPPTAQQEASTPDWFTPIVSLLAGAAMSRGGGLDRVLSGAALAGTGIQATQKAENELLDLKQKRADAQRRRQGQDAIDRYADMLSANPETADIGAAMKVDAGAGMQMFAQRQNEQAKQAQREAHARQLKASGATDYQVAQAMAGQNPGQQAQPPGPAEYGLQAQPYYKTGTDGNQEPWERVYGKDGTFIDRKLPGPLAKFDPNVASSLAASKGFGEGEAKALPVLSQSFTDISVAHDETSRLLTDFETGKYAGDTGPLIGRLKQLWDPDVATLRASATGQQLQNLQIVNLAPVTERELGLIATLGPTPDYTNPQNVAVLKRLVEIQATKKALLKKAIGRINKEGYEAYIRNPVTVTDVKATPVQGAPTAQPTDLTPEEQAELDRLRGAR